MSNDTLTLVDDKAMDIPLGWEDLTLTDGELSALVDYAAAGMFVEAVAVVDGAYGRMFGEHEN
jgi:hypothetical protein